MLGAHKKAPPEILPAESKVFKLLAEAYMHSLIAFAIR